MFFSGLLFPLAFGLTARDASRNMCFGQAQQSTDTTSKKHKATSIFNTESYARTTTQNKSVKKFFVTSHYKLFQNQHQGVSPEPEKEWKSTIKES